MQCLLSTYYAPGTVTDERYMAVNQTDKNLCPAFQLRRQRVNSLSEIFPLLEGCKFPGKTKQTNKSNREGMQGWVCKLSQEVRSGLTEETLEQSLEGVEEGSYAENTPDRGACKCKGPEASVS